MSRKRIPLNQNGCTANFRIGVPFEQNLQSTVSDGSSVKFHTLRKTFATSILKNNAGVERVIDALGNRDSTTVNVYLTYDELHMRKCALSLKEMSIPMGGATK